MFEFLISKKRKEQERLEKEALEARKKRLAQQPYKRNSLNAVNASPTPVSQQIDGNEYSAAYWIAQPESMLQPSIPWREESTHETSNKLSQGSGSFSGAGGSSSWNDSPSSSCSSRSSSSSSYSSSSCGSSSYSSSDSSSSSSSDNSSSCSSD